MRGNDGDDDDDVSFFSRVNAVVVCQKVVGEVALIPTEEAGAKGTRDTAAEYSTL